MRECQTFIRVIQVLYFISPDLVSIPNVLDETGMSL